MEIALDVVHAVGGHDLQCRDGADHGLHVGAAGVQVQIPVTQVGLALARDGAEAARGVVLPLAVHAGIQHELGQGRGGTPGGGEHQPAVGFVVEALLLRPARGERDAQLTWQANPHWRAWAAYSRQKAVIQVPDPTAPSTRGRQIENVPNWLASAGVEYAPTPDWTFSAWGNGQGDYFVERTNILGRYGGYALLNLSASYRVDARNQLALQLKNATDRFYVYAWYDTGSSGYAPGDGRALYLSWTREL